MHDPLCLAAVFLPEMITWEAAYVDVELAGSSTSGETVAYFERLEEIDPSLEHAHPPNMLDGLFPCIWTEYRLDFIFDKPTAYEL